MIVSCLFRPACHVRSIIATKTFIINSNVLVAEVDFEIYIKFFWVTDLSFSIVKRCRKQFYSNSIHLLNVIAQYAKTIVIF